MGAVGVHYRGVPPAAGASLRGCVSGVPVLQSHCRENPRLVCYFIIAPRNVRHCPAIERE